MKRKYLGIFFIVLGILLLIPMFRGLYDYAVMETSLADDTVFGMDFLFLHFLMAISSFLLIWAGVRYLKVRSL